MASWMMPSRRKAATRARPWARLAGEGVLLCGGWVKVGRLAVVAWKLGGFVLWGGVVLGRVGVGLVGLVAAWACEAVLRWDLALVGHPRRGGTVRGKNLMVAVMIVVSSAGWRP
jgi:hypothetical protein